MDVLVDFSGDSGVMGRGTRWLVISAVCDLAGDGSIEACLSAIREQSKYPTERPVHLKGRPHNYKKAVVERLADLDWTSITVASDSTAIAQTSGLAVPQRHMNFAMKYVLERASRVAAGRGEALTFILEEAGNFDVASFREYVRRLRARPPVVDLMAWETVDPDRILVRQKTEDHRLSAADAVSHAFWSALTPDPDWGLLESTYVRTLASRLWRAPDGLALRAGFTFMPTTRSRDFLEEFPELAAAMKPD